MPDIAEIRRQYPQYEDMSDHDLAQALHGKYYRDMPYETFSGKFTDLGVSDPEANAPKTYAPETYSPQTRLPAKPGDSAGQFVPQQEKNMFARISDDFDNRVKDAKQIVIEGMQHHQPARITALRLLLDPGAGFTGDVTGEVVKKGWNALPDDVTHPIEKFSGSLLGSALNSDTGQYLAKGAHNAKQFYKNFEDEYPFFKGYDDIITGLAMGGLGGKAVTTTASLAKKGAKALNSVEHLRPHIDLDDFKDFSHHTYDAISKSGYSIDKSVGGELLASLENTSSRKFIDRDYTKGQIQRLKEAGLGNDNLLFHEAENLDQTLSEMIRTRVETNGHLSDEGRELLKAQDKFRASIQSLPDDGTEHLKDAKSAWVASRKLQDIQRIIESAKNSNDSGTVLRNGFKDLSRNKERMAGYSGEEVKAIKSIIENGITADLAGRLGSNIVNVAVGNKPFGGLAFGGLAAELGDMASRNAAAKAQLKRVNKATNIIAGSAVKYTVPNGERLTVNEVMKLPPKQARPILKNQLPTLRALEEEAMKLPPREGAIALKAAPGEALGIPLFRRFIADESGSVSLSRKAPVPLKEAVGESRPFGEMQRQELMEHFNELAQTIQPIKLSPLKAGETVDSLEAAYLKKLEEKNPIEKKEFFRNKSDNVDIGIYAGGIKKGVKKPYPEKLQMFEQLPNLLQEAKRVGSLPDHKGRDNILAYHYYDAPIELEDGSHGIARLVVREVRQGKGSSRLLYDHQASKIMKEE